MTGSPSDRGADLDAGDFASWLEGINKALSGEGGSEVPCGSCTACCESSQFIDIAPDDTEALEHIPRALLFPAPRRPGHLVLGYDEHGRCPMLVDSRCSIYEHRPRACRVYDCRVLAAAGVELEEGRQALADQAARWRFRYAGPDDETRHLAVRSAAAWLRAEAASLPEEVRPATATQQAVAAVAAADCFAARDPSGSLRPSVPDPRAVSVELSRRLGPPQPAPRSGRGVTRRNGSPADRRTAGRRRTGPDDR